MGVPSADQAAAGGVRARLRRWLSERGLRQWWKVGVTAVLAVAALFGGLDTVDTDRASFAAGEEFDDGQFTLTADRATVVPELRAGTVVLGKMKPGVRYLGLVSTVRNDGTVPGRLAGEFALRDQPGARFVGVMRVADGSPIIWLGPGLREKLAFVWELPDNALRAGDFVTLRVSRKRFQEGFVTYGERWVPLDGYGEVTVPVKVAS